VLCILLMIRLNAEHRALMAKRRVPCLDDYLDRINLLLWPRFKVGQTANRGPPALPSSIRGSVLPVAAAAVEDHAAQHTYQLVF